MTDFKNLPQFSTDLQTIARTIWCESRNSYNGMISVANVINNRVNNPGWWGTTLKDVCLKSNTAQTIFQFSCWNPKGGQRARGLSVTENDKEYKQALQIADSVVNSTISDNTRGSDSYFATYIKPPSWADNRFYKTTINNQRFYHLGLKGDGK